MTFGTSVLSKQKIHLQKLTKLKDNTMNYIQHSMTSLKRASIGFMGALLTMGAINSAAHATDLTLTIGNIRDDNGHVLVALYQGQEAYKSNETDLHQMVKAAKGEAQMVFENLSPGEYAIKMFHDENDNQKLDFNVLGIPKESYGFSNNVGRFGEPEFNEARFVIDEENLSIQIDLQ